MSDRLSGKTFILGIGAQKAGTTWLYRYLDERDDVYMSPIKELHYFDTKHRPKAAGRVDDLIYRALVEKVRSEKVCDYEKDTDFRALVDRISMNYDDTAYRRFFEDRVPAAVPCYGELTPSYSLLSESGFRDIREQFPEIKVIFLLRDPIDRHYSRMRIKERRGVVASANDSFADHLSRPLARAMYQTTIRRLLAVFDESELYFGFYEELFCDETIRQICEFVGLPFRSGHYGNRVNVGPAGSRWKLNSEQIAAGRQRFAEVYDFCYKYFGDRVPAAWHR